MHSGVRISAVALLMAFCTAGGLSAQEGADWGRSGVEINGFAGFFWPTEPDFILGETGFQFENEQELYFGGRLGYTFPINLFIQGEVGYAPLTIQRNGTEFDIKTWLYGGSLGYNFQLARAAQLFVLVGGGVVKWDPDGLENETEPRGHFGGGVRLYLTPNVAVRGEVRDNVMPATLTDVRLELDDLDEIDDELTHNLEVTGGVSLFFGGPRDSDNDGVVDGDDACPGTPTGIVVDDRGCPFDSDRDAVADYLDQCPNTVAGRAVDERGCALDSDADGVEDGADRCPNTPAGTRVSEDGCALDADGDGVPDGIDRCPNTVAGATVNEDGCAADSDGDGVPDGLDRCPSTPAETEVDDQGCSRIEAGIEEGRLILRNVYFDFNSANLRAQSLSVLDEVAQALADRPNVVVEIQGHTDSVGSASYNQQLSQSRAQAVLEYLVTSAQLDRERFMVRGYGESQPIASNETAEGRQENRRVEFIVVER